MSKVCTIEPTRAIVGYSHELIFVKPCGVRYTDRHEVHCSKFEDRTCEYMAKKMITEQYEEQLRQNGEIL